MKNLRLLIWAVVLTVGLGAVTPVLPQSGCGSDNMVTSCGCHDPGQTSTPPCASAQSAIDAPPNPVQLETPSASNAVDITSAIEEALIAFLLF
jgi:hypothetical protein